MRNPVHVFATDYEQFGQAAVAQGSWADCSQGIHDLVPLGFHGSIVSKTRLTLDRPNPGARLPNPSYARRHADSPDRAPGPPGRHRQLAGGTDHPLSQPHLLTVQSRPVPARNGAIHQACTQGPFAGLNMRCAPGLCRPFLLSERPHLSFRGLLPTPTARPSGIQPDRAEPVLRKSPPPSRKPRLLPPS